MVWNLNIVFIRHFIITWQVSTYIIQCSHPIVHARTISAKLHANRGSLYSKFSFAEVYRRVYSQKFRFKATCEHSRKTWFPSIYPMIYLPKWTFEYSYPHSNAPRQFCLKLELCKPHNVTCHPTKCDVVNDVKMFPAVYHRIYTVANFWRYPIRSHITEWSVVGNVIIQM